MKKMLSLILALVLVLSLAACGGTPAPTEPSTEAPTTEAPTTEAPTTEAPTDEPTEETTGELTVMSVTVMMGDKYVRISDNYDDATVRIEYRNEIRKETDMEKSILESIVAELNASGMMALAGASEYGNVDECEDSASFYLMYSDYSSVSAEYYNVKTPEAFVTAFNAFMTYMDTLLADVEEYVPHAQVMGEVDETVLTAIETIMNNSGIENLDSLAIQGIEKGEFFNMNAGLSSDEGIAAAGVCQNMMMGGAAYQLVVVTLEDASKADAVAADFEASLDWGKWVCVRPSDALIAKKDNMVLCLMGSSDAFTGTQNAITEAGWNVVKTLTDGGM